MLQKAVATSARSIPKAIPKEEAISNEPIVVALDKTIARQTQANLLGELNPGQLTGRPVILVCAADELAQPLEQLRQSGSGTIYPIAVDTLDLQAEIDKAVLTAKAVNIVPGSKRKPSKVLFAAAKACTVDWPALFTPEIDLAIEKKSRLAGCAIEFVGGSMLATASALILGRYRAKVREGFTANPTTWVLLNAPSGGNKSNGMSCITDIVRKVEAEHFVKTKSIATLCKANNEEPPVAPRVIYQNTSIEALQHSLAQQGRGGLMEADEAVEWVNSWTRYSAGVGNRGAWLTAHNAEQIMIDRRSLKEPLLLKCWGMSVLAGIQPDALTQYAEALSMQDGMSARIKWLRPTLPPVALKPKPDDHIGIDIIDVAIRNLFEQRLQVTDCQEVPFAKDACDRFEAWRFKLLKKQRDSGRDDPWVSKLPGTVASFALIICAVEAAAVGNAPKEITVDHVKKAAKLADVFTAHRRRVESEIGSPLIERLAAETASWLVKHKVHEVASYELRKGLIPGIRSESTLRRVLLELQDAAWLDSASFISSRPGDAIPPVIKIASGVKDFYAKAN